MSKWKLVPVEATDQMIDAALDAKIGGKVLSCAEIYCAMLDAAPVPVANDCESILDCYAAESQWLSNEIEALKAEAERQRNEAVDASRRGHDEGINDCLRNGLDWAHEAMGGTPGQRAKSERHEQERYRNSDIERRAPARREEMAAFAAELKADPAKAQAFFQSAGILTECGELTLQYGGPAVPAGWRPIDTAPKDEYILAAAGESLWLAYWEADCGAGAWVADEHTMIEPTHWMPLPDAPATTAPVQQAEPTSAVARSGCWYLAFPDRICNKCGRIHGYSHPPPAEVQRLRDALKEILVYGDGAKGFVADSVRKIARRALEGGE